MKKLFILVVVMATFCVSTRLNAQGNPTVTTTAGGNTLGNVNFYVSQNAPGVMTANCQYSDNDSFIQPVFWWKKSSDNDYKNHSPIPGIKYTDHFGNALYNITNLQPCYNYDFKLVFLDGRTQSKDSTEQLNVTVPGNQKPSIGQPTFVVGYNSIRISNFITGHCNPFLYQISYGKVGKLPIQIFNQGYYGDQTISYDIPDLDANQNYVIYLTVSSQFGFGDTTVNYGLNTQSNLPPTIESLGTDISLNGQSEVTFRSFVDPKNTYSSEWSAQWGETFPLDQQSVWYQVYQRSEYYMSISNLKPNTVYFYIYLVRNEFGDNKSEPGMFKTNGDLSGIKPVTFNDLIDVSNYSDGIKIYSEKETTVYVYSLQGSLVESFKCAGGENKILQLKPGVYIVNASIAGHTITKKTFVF